MLDKMQEYNDLDLDKVLGGHDKYSYLSRTP
jgi:hypothetical protein